jgi:hypothetical protein
LNVEALNADETAGSEEETKKGANPGTRAKKSARGKSAA